MRLSEVLVNRSEHHSSRRLVGAWEIPVLQYEYGVEKIEIHGFKKDTRPYPDAGSEYERLTLRYGIDTENGQTKAALAYGQGAMGILAIRNLIDAEKKTEAEEGDALEFVQTVLNVVENPEQDVILAARAAVLAKPGETQPDPQTTLLAQVMEQNKMLTELLMKQQAPAEAPSKATLSLPKSAAA